MTVRAPLTAGEYERSVALVYVPEEKGRTHDGVVLVVTVFVRARLVQGDVFSGRLVVGDEGRKHLGEVADERVALLLEPGLILGRSVVLPCGEGNVRVEVVLAVEEEQVS